MNRRYLCLVVLLVLAISWSSLAAIPWQAPTLLDAQERLAGLGFDEFIDESYRIYLLRSPESLTSTGLADEYGFRNDALDNYSQAFIQETSSIESLIYDRLLEFEPSSLTAEQRTTYDIAVWYWDDVVRAQATADFVYPVHFMNIRSWHGLTEFALTETHPFEVEQDIVDYIARLERIGIQFDQIIDQLERRANLGTIAPKLTLQWAIGAIRTMMTMPSRSHTFYSTLRTKGSQIEELTEGQLQSYLDEASATIDEVVKPAYQRLYSAVNAQISQAPDVISLAQFDGGANAYKSLLRHHTQTELTAPEIHALGLREVDRIQAELRHEAAQLGLPEDSSIASIFDYAHTEGGSLSGDEAVAEAQRLIDAASNLVMSANAFTRLPSMNVVAVGAASGGYYARPAADGSRPGSYYVTTGGTVRQYTQPTIAFHEAIPGHHVQIALSMEAELPLLRQSVGFTGFTEGWALYAERLMSELGFYANNPTGNLGRLSLELLRAVRLVVDTGIHFYQWDFEQAVAYVMENAGNTRGTAEYRVLRYTILPGQATAYMVGMLELLDLRQVAQDALGDEFQLADFHDLVLGNGNVPLTYVQQLVEEWIADQNSSSSGT